MRRLIEQRLMFVLPVQLDQLRREIFEGAGRSESSVDECPAAALRGELASDEQLFPAVIEDRLDRGHLFAGADEVARCASAEKEPDRLNENRLARTGLSGEHVEARVELDFDRIDDRQVSDAQEAKHWEMARTPIVT